MLDSGSSLGFIMDNINRLLSGINILRIGGQIVHVHPFSVVDKTEADFFANELYEDLVLAGNLCLSNLEDFLIENNLWSEEDNKQLKELNDKIEQMKVDYYHGFVRASLREAIRKSIEHAEDIRNQLFTQKNAHADKTCEYIRDYHRAIFLLKRSSYIDGKLIDGDFNLFVLMSNYTKSLLLDAQLREAAKSPKWRSMWSALKGHHDIFHNHPSELTNEQLGLISWSRFYDNINESMDRPSQEIIDDDLALDGWCIVQQRKRKEDEKKQHAERLIPENMDHANEVFVIARNQQEVEEVHSLNDAGGRRIIEMTRRDLEKNKSMKEQDLTYNRQQMQMQANAARRKNG